MGFGRSFPEQGIAIFVMLSEAETSVASCFLTSLALATDSSASLGMTKKLILTGSEKHRVILIAHCFDLSDRSRPATLFHALTDFCKRRAE